MTPMDWFASLEPVLLLKGFLVGLACSVPVGPVGIVVIRRTFLQGRSFGIISGLGASSCDLAFAFLAAGGAALASGVLTDYESLLRLAGGTFLCFLGWRSFRAGRQTVPDPGTRPTYWGSYFTTLFLTFSNPLTILAFAAIFAAMNLVSPGSSLQNAALVALGVSTGSFTWWITLSLIAGDARKRYGSVGAQWMNQAAGILLALFGVAILVWTSVGTGA